MKTPEQEIMAKLKSDATAQIESTDIVSDDSVKLPDMPDSVFDGALGEICQNRLKDFPIAYAYPAILTAASVLVRPNESTLRTNLYTSLVGAVHTGKSESIDRANFQMALRPPFLAQIKAGSAEGLLAKLGDRKGGRVCGEPPAGERPAARVQGVPRGGGS